MLYSVFAFRASEQGWFTAYFVKLGSPSSGNLKKFVCRTQCEKIGGKQYQGKLNTEMWSNALQRTSNAVSNMQ